MHTSQIFALTLASTSMVGTTVSAAGLPPMFNSNNGHALVKRQTPPGLPALDQVETDELVRLYGVYNSVKKIKDFNDAVSKAPPGKVLGTLAQKLGGGATASKVRSSLDSFPSQPQTVIFSFLMDTGKCLIEGKDLAQAVECGKDAVRRLPANDVVAVPKTCNNRLGQLEILGTGWPAPCQDPNAITHPQGNSAHRGLKYGLCRLAELLYPPKLAEMSNRNSGTCAERFPTDEQIKNNLCEKYFGGSPCGGTMPLNTEDDFKRVVEWQKKSREFLAITQPQTKYEGILELQQEAPELFSGPNALPLNGETCMGGKCGEVCQLGKCVPSREVCEPACIPDEADIGKCNCGWDQWRMRCNSCRVPECGECVIKPITQKDGKFFAERGFSKDVELEELHTECRDNGECYFVPNRPRPTLPINP